MANFLSIARAGFALGGKLLKGCGKKILGSGGTRGWRSAFERKFEYLASGKGALMGTRKSGNVSYQVYATTSTGLPPSIAQVRVGSSTRFIPVSPDASRDTTAEALRQYKNWSPIFGPDTELKLSAMA